MSGTAMVEMKTADLTGPVLRYALAIAVGFKVKRLEEGSYKPGEPHYWMVYDEAQVSPRSRGLVGYIEPKPVISIYSFHPDVDWSQGGPLITRLYSLLSPGGNDYGHDATEWTAVVDVPDREPGLSESLFITGATPLMAACRAIVAAELGDVVSVPKELMP